MSDGEVIRTLIQSHRSIRRFKSEPVPQYIIDDLVESARWAPSSHNVQAYSIICIRDQDTKKNLQELCGNQSYIGQCPVFFVFVMDFYRHALVSERHDSAFEVEEVENLLVGAVDTALASENFLLAARSYGLGGVMIGGIRNQAAEVARLLKLPEWTVPVMGMCIGYPGQDPWQKPRIGREAIYHEEHYETHNLEQHLEAYEKTSAEYYWKRTNGQRIDSWSSQMASYFAVKRRAELTDFIKKQGFPLK
ncbi:oxygen-insensitive NADPH nitroreductase [Salimicrobium halophilum]|uniref:Nitroreductase n=1 Tax=Salimicrobium halophilum TaxID=86666 RepID=A0A1G8UG86_9BACI|nr:oxygen-insensitive NADPH nitroreductase [Salimicrobium halophilum]SDJ52886.1 nitroreductase [Salimicrobium halophilum]